MRPLKLVMSAFGPFADEVTIDFTNLGNSGLYLITGDTGSGKTTVFDAISYALYGAPSGEFRDGRMLRSKYAGANRLTFVELTFEAQGKAYVIMRIPDQKRARIRGEGETTQKAEATLTFPDDRQPLTKIAEVDSAMKDIVGLDRKQFSQITMLAQGEFRKLLLSSTDEKQKIFRDIFATEKFERLQDSVKEQCLERKKEYDKGKNEILRDIVSLECGDDFEAREALEEFRSSGQLVKREEFKVLISQLLQSDKEVVGIYTKQLKDLEDALQQLNARIGVSTEQQKSLKELQRVKSELASLKNAKLDREEELKKAEQEMLAVEQLNADAIRIEAKLNDYNQYAELNRDIQSQQHKIQEMEQQQRNRNHILQQCEKDEKRLNEVVDSYKEVDVRLFECEQTIKSMQERKTEIEAMLQDYTYRMKLHTQYMQKQQECQIKTQELEQKSKIHAENEKLFYNAQAGILAEKLVSGEPCPVCGSTEHPRPATKIAEVLTKEQLEDETKFLNGVREQCQLISNAVVQLKEQCDQQATFYSAKALRLFGEENVSEEQLEDEIVRLEKGITEQGNHLQQWQNAKKEFDKAKTELPLLAQKYKQLNAEFQMVEQEKVVCQTESKKLSEQAEVIKEGLQFENVQTAEREISRLRTQANSLVEVHKRATTALQELQQKISAQEGQKQSLEKMLASQQEEDLSALVEQRTHMMKEKNEKEDIKNAVLVRHNHNAALAERIDKEWNDFDVLEQKYLDVKLLSDTMNGELSGKDKVKLETYIQMSYFERVLQRANVRLLGMTGGQYELVRSKQADNQRSQSGLDINVYDYYTSSERSVKSLSGGETFMASLALALGLADEIQSMVGGIHVDTLFVDEGFGSLDEETLRQAMDALLDLTEGGERLVGIISHVAELKNRIPSQIVVTKTADQGSQVKIVTP